ncbi:MAG: Clp protease N-terminal domain-containing protein [Candidatus Dormibacteria bacterium]
MVGAGPELTLSFRDGGAGRGAEAALYPFERFTERAKKVLTLAQEEAERSHHSYIGTEHLLLGLLREGEGLAAKVLNNLGVEINKVRSVIESVLGRNERPIIQQIIPTSRVKKVIEISFEEARRMGNNYVGTEHLLLGLLIEGEGIAAHVLGDLGANLERVRGEIDRLRHEMPPEETEPEGGRGRGSAGPPFDRPSHTVTSHFYAPILAERMRQPSPFDTDEIGHAAERLALEQHTAVGVEHALLAALDGDPLVRRMLAALEVDEAKIAELRRIATPPRRLVELRTEYETKATAWAAQRARSRIVSRPAEEQARVASTDPAAESGAELEELRRLGAELAEAERRWRSGEEPAGDEAAGDEAAGDDAAGGELGPGEVAP